MEVRLWGLSTKAFNLLDPMKVYNFEYWVYVFTGFWGYKSVTKWKTVLYKFYQSVVTFIYVSSLVLFVSDAVVVSDDLEKFSLNMSSTFLLFITLGKVGLFFKEKNCLDNVYNMLDNHLYIESIGNSTEDRNIFKKKARILSSITITFYLFLVLGFPMRVVADVSLRAYLIPVPYIETHYELIYAPQALVILHFLVTVLAHDLLVYAVLVRFIAHFEILEKNFLKIKKLYPRENYVKYVKEFEDYNEQKEVINDVLIRKKNDREKVHKLLKNYTLGGYQGIREKKTFELLKENISHHQKIMREAKTFCRLYSAPLFVQACGAGILIGIAILQLVLLSDRINVLLVEQVLFVVTLLWNIFFLCTFGTELKTKSKAAAEALYETPWYEMDKKNRRIVQIAINEIMKGPELKGGGLIVINRVMYLKFLRISYNFIAVLRHMY